MMKTINEIQEEIIEEFSGFEDWMDKYSLIMDMASSLEPLEDEYKGKFTPNWKGLNMVRKILSIMECIKHLT